MPIEILNRHYLDPTWDELTDYYYIGRGTPLGNPYKVKDVGREEAIELYRQDLYVVIKSKGTQSIKLDAAAAWAELVRLATLYRQGKELHLVCSCKPAGCHGDVLERAIPYVANLLGLMVGDRVRHRDPRCNSHHWHGTIIWTDFTICDVVWDEVMDGVDIKHPFKDRRYTLPRDPQRYPLRLLELIPITQE